MVPATTGTGTWTIDVDAQWSDERDRVSNIDAQKPIGFRWVDADIGVRMDFGSLSVEPFGTVQWLEAQTEDGRSSTDDLFFGGGVRSSWEAESASTRYALRRDPARRRPE